MHQKTASSRAITGRGPMPDFNQIPLFTNARKIKRSLTEDGWRTPDTYTNDQFGQPIAGPAVYLFLLYRRSDFKTVLVAYVGQSINLRQRLASHEILAELRSPDLWTMRWFKSAQSNELRSLEGKYIRHFNPPWNIIGRPRPSVGGEW